MNDERRETIVGFALIAGALLLATALLLGLHERLRAGLVIHVDFDRIGALEEGAPVQVSGRRVGKVRAIRLGAAQDEPPLRARARADLLIFRGHERLVRRNSDVFIGSQALIGATYVEIGPPRGQNVAPGQPCRDGDMLRGADPPRIDELLAQVYRSLVASSDLLRAEQPTLDALRAAARSLAASLHAVAPAGALTRLFAQSRDAFGEAAALVATVREGTEDGRAPRRIRENVSALADRADAIAPLADRAAALLALGDELAALLTPARRAALANAAAQAGASAARIERALHDARFLVSRIDGGETSLGKFLVDHELVDELKELHRLLKSQPQRALGRPPRDQR